MKSNSLTVPSSLIREHGIFSWTTVQKVYNRMPLEITPCKSIYEAKMYSAALLAVLSIVFLPLLAGAWFVYSSAKKGGQA